MDSLKIDYFQVYGLMRERGADMEWQAIFIIIINLTTAIIVTVIIITINFPNIRSVTWNRRARLTHLRVPLDFWTTHAQPLMYVHIMILMIIIMIIIIMIIIIIIIIIIFIIIIITICVSTC